MRLLTRLAMHKCNRCGAEGASKKGRCYFLCKSCRLTEYHAKKNIWKKTDPEEKRRIERAIEWSMLAEQINGAIIFKRAFARRQSSPQNP